jgi:hypothetical protein
MCHPKHFPSLATVLMPLAIDRGYQYEWQGNYLAKGTLGPKFAAAMTPVMAKNGDDEIVFSSQVFKLNTKGKQDDRVLVSGSSEPC